MVGRKGCGWRPIGAVLLSLAAPACGRSLLGTGADEETDESSDTSSESEESTSTGSEDTDTTTEETGFDPEDTGFDESDTTGDEALSCREVLECTLGCLGDLGLECLAACGTNAEPGAVADAGALLFCVGQGCFESGACEFQDFTATSCVACLGVGLLVPQPPGCEVEAAACR